ncbi:MAG: peptidylprolyl isomerase [Candidatus Korobacteraceae bacterium]
MPRFGLLALAIWCAVSYSSYALQQQPSAPSAPGANEQSSSSAPVASATAVPMTEPVLTLKGACKAATGATAPPAGCVSSLTREQFEKLITSLSPPGRPPMPPDKRRTFATQYAKLLTFADAARAMGLENDPRVQDIFNFAKDQILTEALNQQITTEYSHPTEQQIADYYNKNGSKYLEVTLQRIIIPRLTATTDKPKPTEAEEKAYAEKVRERLIAGEDADKLQKEASEHAGSPGPPPSTQVGARRPGSLPDAHESVFNLTAGEVSELFSDPGAFYVYKVVSVRQVPLSEVKESISNALQRQMVTDRIQEIQNSVTPVLNEAYFGPEAPPGAPTGMTPPGRGMPVGPAGGPPPPGRGPAQQPQSPPPPEPQ